MPLLLPSEADPCENLCLEFLADTDWLALADQFDLAAAFFASLRERKLLSALPSAAREKLERAYDKNAARQLMFCTLLTRMLDALQSLSRPPILLKGIAFAYELYPDPNARFVGDIDLMLDSEEVAIALDQLTSIGFKRVPPPLKRGGAVNELAWSIGLGPAYQQIMRRIKGPSEERETYLKTHIGGMEALVEIHHGLINLTPGSLRERIFHTQPECDVRTRSLSLEIGEVRVIDYESAFLHAVRHIALHHRLIGFRWHHDLALMLANWQDHLKPERILEHARMLGSHKIVRVELAILEELFGQAIFSHEDRERWMKDPLPFEYPLYRRVALEGLRTPLRELVRPLLAPSFKEQLIALLS